MQQTKTRELEIPYWPQEKQQEAFNRLAPYNNKSVVGFGGPKFGGKAQPLDARILTPFGWRTMGDMEVGSKVLNPDGSIQSVIQIHPQGKKQTYRVSFCDGASTEVTADHLWKVRLRGKKNGEKVFGWKICDTNYLISYLEKERNQYPVVPLTKPLRYTKTYSVETIRLDPYLMGVLLGDGCLSRESEVTFCTADQEIVEKIRALGYELTDMSSDYDYLFVSDSAKTLRDNLEWYGLLGKKSTEKFIPEYYQYMSVEGRKKLIQGLLDTDGTIDERGHCTYSTSSKTMAENIQHILWSLGARATISKKKTPRKKSYRITFKSEIDPELFSLERKRDRAKYYNCDSFQSRKPKRRIVSIEPSRVVECQCITVNNPNRLYITDDFIVTHNSWAIRAWMFLQCQHKPLHCAVFVREYDSLKDLHIEPLTHELSEWIDAGKIQWNANNKQFIFHDTGSVLKMMQVNRPAEIHKHNGKGFDIVALDEAQKFTDFELKFFRGIVRPSAIATNARSRVRNKMKAADDEEEREYYREILDNIYYHPKLFICFNWGDAGHQYLVSRFWEGCDHPDNPGQDLEQFETEEVKDPETGEAKKRWLEKPEEFTYVFSHWKDNPAGYKENPQYINALRAYPEPFRTAYLKGDPYAFTGLKYSIVEPIHEIDMDKILEPHGGYVPEHWRLIGALDPGTADFCSFALYCKDPAGNMYQISDYYHKGRSAENNIDQIYYHIKHNRWTGGQMPEYIIAGKDAFHRKSKLAIRSHDITWSDIFRDKYGLKLYPCNNDRVVGAMAVANAIDYDLDDNGDFRRKPRLYFAKYYEKVEGAEQYEKIRVCKTTIEELTSLESDDKNPEDIKEGPNINDHAFDRTKYFLLGAVSGHKEKEKAEDELYETTDYGRIPESKVWKKQKTEDPLDTAMGGGPLGF